MPGWWITQGIETRVQDALQRAVAGRPADGRVRVTDSTGLNARIGGRGRHFAGEIQLEYLPGFDVEVSDTKLFSYALLVATANVKLQLPLGRFEPYVLAGVRVSRALFDAPLNPAVPDGATGGAFRLGGGANLHLNEHVALSLDASYLLPTGDNEDLAYVSIGLGMVYHF